MKLLTKRWYQLMQYSKVYMLLKQEERAGSFSESFFQELFKKEMEEYICKEKKTAETIKNAYKNKWEKGQDKDVKEWYKETYGQNVDENIRATFIKSVDKQFKYLCMALPQRIRSNIADLRVASLGYTTADNIGIIKEYCNKCMEETNNIILNYNNHFEKIKDRLPLLYQSIYNIHDAFIKDIIFNEDNYTFIMAKLESDNIKQISFHDYIILEEECDLRNARWLYDEVYIKKDKYEIHILLDKNEELYYFTIQAQDITYE